MIFDSANKFGEKESTKQVLRFLPLYFKDHCIEFCFQFSTSVSIISKSCINEPFAMHIVFKLIC